MGRGKERKNGFVIERERKTEKRFVKEWNRKRGLEKVMKAKERHWR